MDKKITAALKTGGLYWLAIILPLLPWLFFKTKYHLSFSNVEPGLGYHKEIWANVYQSLFLTNSFNIWWFVVIVSLLINLVKIKRQNSLLLAWLFLVFCLSGLILLYLFTGEYRFAVDNTALSRNLLTLLPISVALVGSSYRQTGERA